MNTLEISTVTILHTLSTLNRDELDFLLCIAQNTDSSTFSELALPEGKDTTFLNELFQQVLKKFNVQNINELRSILIEINFLSMIRNTSLV